MHPVDGEQPTAGNAGALVAEILGRAGVVVGTCACHRRVGALALLTGVLRTGVGIRTGRWAGRFYSDLRGDVAGRRCYVRRRHFGHIIARRVLARGIGRLRFHRCGPRLRAPGQRHGQQAEPRPPSSCCRNHGWTMQRVPAQVALVPQAGEPSQASPLIGKRPCYRSCPWRRAFRWGTARAYTSSRPCTGRLCMGRHRRSR
jgi:hypothetical protein